MAVPSWFDATYYFNEKLASMGEGWDSTQLVAAFTSAGYKMDTADNREQSLFDHFNTYGKFEGVNPSDYFNADEYIYAKAVDFYAKVQGVLPAAVVVTEFMLQSMRAAIAGANLSPWDHYEQYGAAEGLNPSTHFDSAKYIKAKTAQMNAMNEGAGYENQQWTEAEVLEILSDGMTPLTHYFDYGYDEGLDAYGFELGTVTPGDSGVTKNLTPGRDTILGTNGNDQFNGLVSGDLGNGDEIDGAGGFDTVTAVVGGENDDLIQPWLTNVEKVVLQAQTGTTDGGHNAVSGHVNVDAGKILGKVDSDFYTEAYGSDQGLQYLYNNSSRASLTVEDVKSYSTDMHIGWLNGNPTSYTNGEADLNYEVYFHSQYLKPQGATSTGTINIEIMDVMNSDINEVHSLQDNVWDTMVFTIAGKEYRLTASTGYDGTINSMYDALAAALLANPELDALIDINLQAETYTASGYSESLGQTYTYSQGHRIVVSANTSNITFDGWISSSGKPTKPGGVIAWAANVGSTETCPLIQTNIHLDNVGTVQWTDLYEKCLPDEEIFGSASGDMVVGAYDNRAGIQRFDVVVDQGSWLSSLSSTNNTLRVVTVKAGDINLDKHVSNIDKYANNDHTGELFIGKSLEAYSEEIAHWTLKPALLSTDGLTDVKLFTADVDGVAYDGNLNIGAKFTNEGYEKYLHDVDGINTVYSGYAPSGAFEYTLGKANDILNMQLHGGMSADNDFVMNINAGEGNDLVNLFWRNEANDGTYTNMTPQQVLDSAALRNVTVNGGLGDDTVWTWEEGAVTVNGGEGKDVVYVGQTERDHNAVWAFNVDPAHKQIDVTAAGAQAHDNNFLSGLGYANVAWNGAAGDFFTGLAVPAGTTSTIGVKVDFLGFTSAYVAIEGYSVNDAGVLSYTNPIDHTSTVVTSVSTIHINQAIIKAIANDATLSKVLEGKDGAGYGLIIESIIDGLMNPDDLNILFFQKNGGNPEAGLPYNGDHYGDPAGNDFADIVDTVTTLFPANDPTSPGAQADGANDSFTAADAAMLIGVANDGDFYSIEIEGVVYELGTVADLTTDGTNLLTAMQGNAALVAAWDISYATGVFTFDRVDASDNVTSPFASGLEVGAATTSQADATTALAAAASTDTDATGNYFEADLSGVALADAYFAIEIGGDTYYAQQTGGLTLQQLLDAATLNNDSTTLLSAAWDIDATNPAMVEFTSTDVTQNVPGFTPPATEVGTSATLEVTTTGPQPATGTDDGSYSINRVNGGLGDDVIVLNAGSEIDLAANLGTPDHFIRDTLVIDGEFGDDSVFNFDVLGTPTTGPDVALDMIDLSAIGTVGRVNGITSASLFNTDNSINYANVLTAINGGAFYNDLNLHGAAVVQLDAGQTYYVFSTNAGADSVLQSGEIKLLGTITFDDHTGAVTDDNLVLGA